MDQRFGRTWRGDSFPALQVELGSVGIFRWCLMAMGWVWLGCLRCQKGCNRHRQDCVKFFGGGGGNPIFFVEALEKHFREWRDV